jgi:Protein of unknown function (DUF3306)
MDAESFFSRWSKPKAEAVKEPPQEAPAPVAPKEVPPPPTMEDVAKLTPDSDFKRFVARDVDEGVRRSAMKKLFADPQFNVMDGLDVYIGDYNKFEPITPAMLAQLNHAKALLDPLANLAAPLMRLIETPLERPEEETQQVSPPVEPAPVLPPAAAIPDAAAPDALHHDDIPDRGNDDDAI